MVKYLLLGFIAFFCNSIFSQETKKITETDSLYINAISKYIDDLRAYNKQYFPNSKELPIYIQHEEYLNLPKKINDCEIIILTYSNRYNYFKANENNLCLLKIWPLSFEEGKFYIHLVPYGAKMKNRKKLFLEYGSWARVYFELENNKLKYKEIETGGI